MVNVPLSGRQLSKDFLGLYLRTYRQAVEAVMGSSGAIVSGWLESVSRSIKDFRMKHSHQLNFNGPAPDLTLVSTTQDRVRIQVCGHSVRYCWHSPGILAVPNAS